MAAKTPPSSKSSLSPERLERLEAIENLRELVEETELRVRLHKARAELKQLHSSRPKAG